MSSEHSSPFAHDQEEQAYAASREPIAIIGIGCRFPGGADGPEAFWKLLTEGRDAVVPVPSDRWDLQSFYDPDPQKPGKATTFRGGFLDQVDQFDAHFFGISPREADYLDPQQRILAEVAWNSMEDAGLLPEALAGKPVGVFMGAFTLDYKILQFQDREAVSTHTAVGAMMTIVAARLSYLFDFRGPCVSLDTACSSSLTAVHLACQSLWNQECEMALAGGVNVMTTPDYTIAESKGGFLSPDGASKAFDSRANGYVRGEGAGIVVLKPLSAAQADGDPIYAVIRGTAANHDGRTKGITVPSQAAQEQLIATAYARGGVAPHQVRYVEAHGTGTAVGDPIEANALHNILSTNRPENDKCIVGSCKTNIGHLEAAAGIAGLIKTALILKHRQVPPHLHFLQANPAIPFDKMAIRIPTQLEPLPNGDGPIYAGVNSFGFGGSNAHALLQAVPQTISAVDEKAANGYLLPLSARSPEALKALAQQYIHLLEDAQCPPLEDLLYTAAVRRSHHPYRLAVVGHSAEELREKLAAFLTDEERPNMSTGRLIPGQEPRLVFVFTGMGPQWWAMGRELYEQEPLFREALEKYDRIFQKHAGWSVLAAMLVAEEQSEMAETRVAQPANVLIQLALIEMWRAWGVEPEAVVGHSVGEIVSGYLSGIMTLEDTLLVAHHRSRLQQLTTGTGSMLAVGLSEEAVQPYLQDYESDVSIGAINSPLSVTLAGNTAVLEKLAQQFEAEKIFNKMLGVKIPYHSPCMDPIQEELLESLAPLAPRLPALPIYSTVTGEPITGVAFNAAYWWQNVRRTVRFAKATRGLLEEGYNIFVEVGPHPVLAYSMRESLDKAAAELSEKPTATFISSMRRKEPEKAKLLGALGELYCAGYPVDWCKLYSEGQVVSIPTYPWQRERYWAESEAARQQRLGHKAHPLLGRRLPAPQPVWAGELNPYYLTYLQDHCIQGATVYPGAGYAEMALAASANAYQSDYALIEGLSFHKALFLAEHAVMQTQVRIDPQTAAFEIYSRPAGANQPWSLNSSGRLRQPPANGLAKQPDFKTELAARCSETVSVADCYAQFQQKGFDYGPTFQGICALQRGRYDALAEIVLPESLQAESDAYFFHPALLDATFQAMVAVDAFGQSDPTKSDVYLPVSIDRLIVYTRPGQRIWSHAHIVEKTENGIVGDIHIFDETGQVVAVIEGFRAQSLAQEGAPRPEKANEWLYEMAWIAQDKAEQASPSVAPGTWLVLLDETGTGTAVQQQLEAIGHTCITISTGQVEGDYVVDPADTAVFSKALEESIAKAGTSLRGILYLWGLNSPPSAKMGLSQLEAFENMGPLALKRLVQGLVQQGVAAPLWVVTRGAQAVTDEQSPLAVAQATLWGIGRVIGHQEHVKLWGGIIDLDPDASTDDVQALVNELLYPDEEDQIALRQQQRYVVRLEYSETKPSALPPAIRTDGSYVITGGLGALGLLVAHWLVQQGARSLVLLSRSPLPPRREWNSVQSGSPLATRIAGIRALEAQGARVHVAAVDVTDELQLHRFLTEYRQEGWPEIRGVIHSAGLVQDQLLTQMDDETFLKILQPKVLGGWALHQVFKKVSLDFFILFSSVASLVAQTGQANYAAGNAFLDTLAFFRRAEGLPALSINWGPWLVGMIKDLDLVEHYRRRGMDSIGAEIGIEFLEKVFNFPKPQIAVFAADWPLVLEFYPRVPLQVAHLGKEPEAAEGESDAEQGTFLEQIGRLAEEERQQFIETRLLELLARVLRMSTERLEPEIPLTALGMDSLIATELRNRIDLQLGINLTVVELLQGLTVAQLAERALAQLEPQLEEKAQLAALLEGDIDMAALQELASEETLAELLEEVEHLSEDDIAAMLG